MKITPTYALVVGSGLGLVALGVALYAMTKPGATTPAAQNTTGNNPVAPIPGASGATQYGGSPEV